MRHVFEFAGSADGSHEYAFETADIPGSSGQALAIQHSQNIRDSFWLREGTDLKQL